MPGKFHNLMFALNCVTLKNTIIFIKGYLQTTMACVCQALCHTDSPASDRLPANDRQLRQSVWLPGRTATGRGSVP